MDNIQQINAGNLPSGAAKPTTIMGYIMSVEDPSLKGKVGYFLAVKYNNCSTHWDVNGCWLENKANADLIKNKTDIDTVINSMDKYNIYFPINRVINIRIIRA